jgi:hypothetical protein
MVAYNPIKYLAASRVYIKVYLPLNIPPEHIEE